MLYEIFWVRYSFITSRALQIKEQSNYKYVMQMIYNVYIGIKWQSFLRVIKTAPVHD